MVSLSNSCLPQTKGRKGSRKGPTWSWGRAQTRQIWDLGDGTFLWAGWSDWINELCLHELPPMWRQKKNRSGHQNPLLSWENRQLHSLYPPIHSPRNSFLSSLSRLPFSPPLFPPVDSYQKLSELPESWICSNLKRAGEPQKEILSAFISIPI